MVLKRVNPKVRLHPDFWVAIEPLWYWNYAKTSLSNNTQTRCNRTIMVLKRLYCMGTPPPRTGLQSNHYGIETSFGVAQLEGFFRVAIEPLWYWNSQRKHLTGRDRLRLQSNHYGIETMEILSDTKRIYGVAIEPLWYWNVMQLNGTVLVYRWLQSNHYGIETGATAYWVSEGTAVAIEPLWYWN